MYRNNVPTFSLMFCRFAGVWCCQKEYAAKIILVSRCGGYSAKYLNHGKLQNVCFRLNYLKGISLFQNLNGKKLQVGLGRNQRLWPTVGTVSFCLESYKKGFEPQRKGQKIFLGIISGLRVLKNAWPGFVVLLLKKTGLRDNIIKLWCWQKQTEWAFLHLPIAKFLFMPTSPILRMCVHLGLLANAPLCLSLI